MPNVREIVASPSPELYRASSYANGGRLQPPPREMTMQEFFAIVSRRRRLITIVAFTTLAVAIALCASKTRMYKASASIQVQKDSVDALSLNNVMGTNVPPSDALDASIALQTQAQILQSETLAIRVIKALQLENTFDFQPGRGALERLLGLFSGPKTAELQSAGVDDQSDRRSQAVKVFEANLKVKPLAGTRVIQIEYLSSDRRIAAAVVNALIDNLIDYNFETRQGATQKASGWLANQLSDLRHQSEVLQAKVVEMQRDSGVFSDGQTDAQGRQQVYAPELDRLQQASVRLGEARSSRIMKGALYEAIKRGDPELISSLAGSGTLQGSSSGLAGSLTLLQNLRAQEAQTQAQLNELSAKFGPNYPKVAELQAGLAGTQKAIQDESARIAARARNDYETSKRVEDQESADFADQKKRAETLNSKAVEYEITRQEATQSRSLYESLLGRLKEADLIAGLRSSNIAVVDSARVPSKPSKPNIILYTAGGLVAGIVLGLVAALFHHATDHRLFDIGETRAALGESLIGFVPHNDLLKTRSRGMLRKGNRAPLEITAARRGNLRILAQIEPHCAFTEALRAVRSALERTNRHGPPPQIILVTSSIPGEGKTSLSINLATVHAHSGKKVLLVDTDLRTPTLGDRLGIVQKGGLSSLLLRKESEELPVHIPLDHGAVLDVVPAGPVPAYPTELLASDGMSDLVTMWRREYDYIFLDSAPLLPVTDAALLSRIADFTVVVARHNMTDLRSLERTSELLRLQGVHNAGIVLNGIKVSSAAHFRHYGYHERAYYGGKIGA